MAKCSDNDSYHTGPINCTRNESSQIQGTFFTKSNTEVEYRLYLICPKPPCSDSYHASVKHVQVVARINVSSQH